MPAFITLPNPQTYPPVTLPSAQRGIPFYSWGYNNDYANAPETDVEVAEVLPTELTFGRQCAVPNYVGTADNSSAISWEGTYGDSVAAATVSLYGAVRGLGNTTSYFLIDTDTSGANFLRTVHLGQTKVNALVIVVNSSEEGGSPVGPGSFIGKILI